MNEKINTNNLDNDVLLDPIQIKVDKVAGYVILFLGSTFLWPFIYPLLYGEAPSKHALVYIYSILIIIMCARKGYILIRDAGGPATAGMRDKRHWIIRGPLIIVLIVLYLILISGVMGIDGIKMFVVGFPALITLM